MTETAEVRVDRWLWAARLYKTRSMATTAVRGGRVHVNGQRAKPSRVLRVGDVLQVNRNEWRMELTVTGLSDRRGPARIAATLYEETAASAEQRALARQGRRAERAAAPPGRPDKRARRQLRRFSRGR
ncbi:MAG: RNA-binding protein [Gammaproteobacteria bacterium]|nr:RNA-binding protein [Gammaproteobacteria bacterium]NNF62338.1 RNA-binding protein [Gammaproteobacteria bacterium]NNM21002.1 RNA-binding protein [Gammaproteobacteria bacterium]